MSHSVHYNYGHIVFHTRSARIQIHPDDLLRVHGYIRGIGRQLGVQYMVVGGIEDHVHILGNFPMNRLQCDIVKDIKVSTSRWLSGLHSRYRNFYWQGGYGYFSVSPNRFNDVAGYIARQPEHHLHETTQQEYERMKAQAESFIPFMDDGTPFPLSPRRQAR